MQGPNADPEADAEITIASHEHFEIVTDPQPDVNTAWADAGGFEIGDKCAFTYGALYSDSSNVVLHGHRYLVQQEWSNADNGCALANRPPSVGGLAEDATMTQGSGVAGVDDARRAWSLLCAEAGVTGLAVAALWHARRWRFHGR